MRLRLHRTEDHTIDLTDRLAPYHGSSTPPKGRRRKPAPVVVEEPIWTPLEFDFPYATSERSPT